MRVVVNGTRVVSATRGQTLFSALKEAGIHVPSICGGRGACGRCRVQVEEGAGEFTAAELKKLTDAERADGTRLSCQVICGQPLRVQIAADLLGVKTFDSEVVNLRDLTYDIREIRLRLLNPDCIRFRAGQYVQVRVPAYGNSSQPVYRAYSIASDPASTGEIELEVRRVPNGVGTTYLHTQLAPGAKVTLYGPEGDFTMRDGDRDVVFIAGGSGMAPIRSMLFDAVRSGDRRRMTYFFGAKAVRDLFLVHEMREFERHLPSFAFVPALSEPAPGDNWAGETGLITQVVGRRMGSCAGMDVYLCGSPPMIDACLGVLQEKGVPTDRVFYDKYV